MVLFLFNISKEQCVEVLIVEYSQMVWLAEQEKILQKFEILNSITATFRGFISYYILQFVQCESLLKLSHKKPSEKKLWSNYHNTMLNGHIHEKHKIIICNWTWHRREYMNKNLIDFKLLHAVCRVQMNCFSLNILWRRLRNCSGYVHLLLERVMFKRSWWWSVKYQRRDESTLKVIWLVSKIMKLFIAFFWSFAIYNYLDKYFLSTLLQVFILKISKLYFIIVKLYQLSQGQFDGA